MDGDQLWPLAGERRTSLAHRPGTSSDATASNHSKLSQTVNGLLYALDTLRLRRLRICSINRGWKTYFCSAIEIKTGVLRHTGERNVIPESRIPPRSTAD